MDSGQGSSVAKGSRYGAKWVYHQENTGQGVPKICLNNGVVLPFFSRNELRPHKCNLTVCFQRRTIVIFFFIVIFSWLRGQWVSSWGLAWAQKRIYCLLMCPLKWNWDLSLKKIKSNKPGSFSFLWLISSQNVSRSALLWSACLSKIWILLSKGFQVIMDSQNWCSRNARFLWQTACWFSGGLRKVFPQTMSTTVVFVGICHTSCHKMWPPNVELFYYQVYSCQNLFCIATVSKELILWQSTPPWTLFAV